MELLRDAHAGDPARDMEISAELLDAVASGDAADTARVYRPGPTVAFGRLDRGRVGFERACEIAREHGRVPLVRLGGGHAVVYDQGSLIVEFVRRHERSFEGLEPRFVEVTTVIQQVLRASGVALELGELPDEYCPGRFSLHFRDGPKVAGVAQRVRPRASLTTAVIAVTGGDELRAVTASVYAALELPLALATVGAISDRERSIGIEGIEEHLAERVARLR
jgi:octanoyl-[GcvH]:protein N-octanoyltransferase